MTNLVFDLSNMLFRSMNVLGGFGQEVYTFDNEKETDELMRKISMDISYLIRLINPSRVIFALDHKSWRKTIKIEENEGYKGNRKKSSHVNWENVYGILDEFAGIMEDNGMIISKVNMAEADDLMALWVDELVFNQKQHVITVSGDEDIRQLVKFNPYEPGKLAFSTVFNPFMQGKNAARKLYVPEEIFNNWLSKEEEVDIWNMSGSIDMDKEDFKRIRDTDKVRIEEVDGNAIAMRKVFCGDDGDNIPAIHTWMTTTAKGDPKEVRITNAKYNKIFESLKTSPDENIDHYDLMERTDKIAQGIKKICKQDLPFDIETRLKRQIKLVVLDKAVFPETIVEDFEGEIEAALEKPRPEISNINMNTMLQGTRYVRAKSGGTGRGTEMSIFKEIDKMSNKKLF